MTGDRSRERWKRRSSASTRASSSRRIERPGDDVVGAGLEEPDPLLDVLAGLTHRTGTAAIDGVARISRQISIADFGPGDDVEDDELVLGDLG